MKNSGFILLMSILILSVLASLAVLEMSGLVFEYYKTTYDVIHYDESKALALSCRNEALLSLAENPQFATTSETLNVGSAAASSCTIVAVEPNPASSTEIQIETSATSADAVSNVLNEISIQKNGLTIDSSGEAEKF